MKRSVMFVDDEPNVLDGIRRMLRGKRDEWDMEFVSSGAEALALMEGRHFDVVVSDMRMPGMNGVELLSQVKDLYPETVRLMLTGNADQETAMEAVNSGQIFVFSPNPARRRPSSPRWPWRCASTG